MWFNDAACSIACPQHEKDKFDLKFNGHAINYKLLNKDSAKPFCAWVCATECSTSIPIDVQ